MLVGKNPDKYSASTSTGRGQGKKVSWPGYEVMLSPSSAIPASDINMQCVSSEQSAMFIWVQSPVHAPLLASLGIRTVLGCTVGDAFTELVVAGKIFVAKKYL